MHDYQTPLLLKPSLYQAVGCVWQEDAAQCQHQGWHTCESQGHPPTPRPKLPSPYIYDLRQHNPQCQDHLRSTEVLCIEGVLFPAHI